MLNELAGLLPPDALKILLVFSLSFLLGLEREEGRVGSNEYTFGGVRTFPLIGLTGYAAALLSGAEFWLFSLGFLSIGGLMLLSYRHKLSLDKEAGLATEISGLMTYVLGALVFREMYWIASTLVICSLLLMELKTWLETISRRLPSEEILTFTKFLLLSVVILPVVPNVAFGPFEINPFKTWLVVVATSAISYFSYIIQKLLKGRGGILVAAILGGAYSSTVTTVVLSRKARTELRPHLYSGAILAASGMMYLRLSILVFVFNSDLFQVLGPSFIGLAAMALAGGTFWSKFADASSTTEKQEYPPNNPLELRTAFLFALFFIAMLVISKFSVDHFGKSGVYTLAGLMGLTDVDPFILSMTQSKTIALEIASVSILIAAASNNALKGLYTLVLAKGKTGLQGVLLLGALTLLGLAPLFWISREI